MYISIMLPLQLNVRGLRISKCMSQSTLAHLSGIRQATLSRIESGQVYPRARTLMSLAQALSVTPTALFLNPGDEARGLSRQRADMLAKAIVTGNYPRNRRDANFCLAFALWHGEKLRAQGVAGWKKIRRMHIHSAHRPLWMKQTYTKGVRDQILWRVNKVLAGALHEAAGH